MRALLGLELSVAHASARRDPAAARAMAERGRDQIANNLSMDIVERYWAALLTRYAALLRQNAVGDRPLDVRGFLLPTA